MQFIIANVDVQDAIHHGEHYFVKRFFADTQTAVVEAGRDGGEYKLYKGQYTTEQEQRSKYAELLASQKQKLVS